MSAGDSQLKLFEDFSNDFYFSSGSEVIDFTFDYSPTVQILVEN